MILSREQINRYLRHIIMPEISGPGQKNLESSVFICGENVNDVAPAIYYLAASGIGSIACFFADETGFDNLVTRIHDLNSEITIGITDGRNSDFRIFFGRPDFIKSCNSQFDHFATSIISIYSDVINQEGTRQLE